MWQRFTERARRAVFLAQEQAVKHKTAEVTPELLLLAIVQEDLTTAAEALDLCNVSLQRVREAVEAVIPTGGDFSPQDMTLTREAKRVIERAYEFARLINVSYIGTEILLMGVACVDSPAKAVLEALDADAMALSVAIRAICIRERDRAERVGIPAEIDLRVKALAEAEKCAWGPLTLRLLMEALDARDAAPTPAAQRDEARAALSARDQQLAAAKVVAEAAERWLRLQGAYSGASVIGESPVPSALNDLGAAVEAWRAGREGERG